MNPRVLRLIVRIIVFVTVIPFHEFAHGWAAGKLGDPTAKMAGRNTLNPLRHLDKFGLICLVFTGFGWAKPVPVNANYFKHPKRDMALTALAGPAANILMGYLLLIALKLGMLLFGFSYYPFWITYILIDTTVALAVFNMIPVPPLDGSRIFTALLPDKAYYTLLRYEKYLVPVLMVLLITGVISFPLDGAANAILHLLDAASAFLGRLF